MKRIKKKYLLIALFFISLLFLSAIFAPKFISTRKIREIVQTEISKLVDAKVEYEYVSLSFFPLPSLRFSNVSFSIPSGFSGSVEEIEVGPNIPAIFRGEFSLAKLVVNHPYVQMDIKDIRNREEAGSEDEFSLKIKKSLEHARQMAKKFHSNFEYIINDGSLDLLGESRYFFKFNDLDAKIKVDEGKCEITAGCQSSIWNRIEFYSAFDLKSFDSKGYLKFDKLRPQKITDALYKVSDWQMGDNSIPLSIDFITNGFKSAYAKIESSIPSIILLQNDKKIVIEGGALKGFLQIREEDIELVVEDLHLDYPNMNVSGRMLMNSNFSDISLDISGKDIEVSPTKQVSLALFGKNKVVKRIFQILTEGNVPDISFKSKGDSFKELFRLDSFCLSGNLRDGSIFIPGIDLSIADTSGKVEISGGLLMGSDLEAHIGNSVGRFGNLLLGLHRDDRRLQLNLMLDASLPDVPPILKQIVEHDIFDREMDLIQDVDGRIKGKLVLGDDLNDLKVVFDAQDMVVEKLSYERIPFPIHVASGKLRYENDKIEVADISGSVGDSTFSDLSFVVEDWDTPQFDIHSKSAFVKIGQLYPWTDSFENINHIYEDLKLKRLDGDLSLEFLDLRGPIFEPDKWQFHLAGTPEKLTVDSGLLAEETVVHGGRIETDQNVIKIKKSDVVSLNSTFLLTGIFYNYKEGVDRFDLFFSGTMGSHTFDWIYSIVEIPEEFKINGPIQISKGEVSWNVQNDFSIFGDFSVKDGPDVSIDMEGGAESLYVRYLNIKDAESNAVIGYEDDTGSLKVFFSGLLKKKTADALLRENTYFKGILTGDMAATFNLEKPDLSEAYGMLYGEKFTLPLFTPEIYWKAFYLSGEDNGICIDNSVASYGGVTGELQGVFAFEPNRFYFDIDTFSESICWEKLGEKLEEESRKEDGDTGSDSSWPVSGKIRVISDLFKYEDKEFTSVDADFLYSKEKIQVVINDSLFCGVSVPGIFEVYADNLFLSLSPVAKGQDLLKSLDCFSDIKPFIRGRYALNGEFYAKGTEETFPLTVGGELHFEAEEGRIYRFVVLAKIFSVINLKDILRGEVPDLLKEGFPYKSIKIDGNLRGDRFFFKAVMDNASMGISCNGYVNIDDETLNLTVLVAPFKTVDYVITRIPVVKEIFDGSLISIPVKVTGSFQDPKITVADPNAVEDEVVGILERAINLVKPVIENGENLGQKISKKIQGKKDGE